MNWLEKSRSDDTDDERDIVTYEWGMVEGKLNEKDLLRDVDLRQPDLERAFTEPGSYTFELTVTE